MAKLSKKAEIANRVRDAGERAKAEAEERRATEAAPPAAPHENNGAKGPEPTRFGDWERKGIVSDF